MSAFVVPGRAGMPEDGSMLPWKRQPDLFPELLELEVERLQIKVERARLKLERERAKARRTPAPAPGKTARRRLPANTKHHTWRGFVLDMQRLEGLLDSDQRVTREALALLGPDTAQTITRTARGYGLATADWPPSTWNPDEARVYQPGNRSHKLSDGS
ncbi:MAG TPA: hypothetical protein VFB50_17635 [Chloroflexota bacterium]|nr:hypothetical protein [Chloroflexota bacterium]